MSGLPSTRGLDVTEACPGKSREDALGTSPFLRLIQTWTSKLLYLLCPWTPALPLPGTCWTQEALETVQIKQDRLQQITPTPPSELCSTGKWINYATNWEIFWYLNANFDFSYRIPYWNLCYMNMWVKTLQLTHCCSTVALLFAFTSCLWDGSISAFYFTVWVGLKHIFSLFISAEKY